MIAADEFIPSIIDLSRGPWTKIVLPTSATPGAQGQIEWVETSTGALIADLYSAEAVDGSGNVIQQLIQLTSAYPLGPSGTRPAMTRQVIAFLSELMGADNANTSFQLTTAEASTPGALATHEIVANIQPGLRGATGFTRSLIDALGQSNFLQWFGNGSAAKSNLSFQIGNVASLAVASGISQVSVPVARRWTTHSFFFCWVTGAPTNLNNVYAMGVQDQSNGFIKVNSPAAQNISLSYISVGS